MVSLFTDTLRDFLHPRCIACAPTHPSGFQLRFRACAEGGVETELACGPQLEGYPGLVHGGVISLVFDSAMANCMFAHGHRAVTAELTVRFVNPVALGGSARVRAHVTKDMHPLYVLEAFLEQDGAVKARATGKFMVQPQSD